MKRTYLQNTEISREIAAIGHTQTIAIADLGLPIPKGVRCIDLALTRGVPTFWQVLQAVATEMKVESVILADELRKCGSEQIKSIADETQTQEIKFVPHTQFKKLTEECNCIIRTGECTPYCNAILVSGVDF